MNTKTSAHDLRHASKPIARKFTSTVIRWAASACAVFAATGLRAQFPDLPAAPLSVQGIGDPNIIFTFDTSTSMQLDHVPDSANTGRRRLASKWNAITYNPSYIYEAPYDVNLLNGTKIANSFTSALIYGFDPAGGTVNLATSYRSHNRYEKGVAAASANYGTRGRATFDSRTTTGADGLVNFPEGRAFFYAFYNDLGPNGEVPAVGQAMSTFARGTVAPAGCAGLADTANDRCYRFVSVPASHEANFANWFSFYRTRELLTRAGANLAFYALPTNYRVTWQGLLSCNAFNSACTGWNGVSYPNVFRPLSNATHRRNFLNWLSYSSTVSSTPLIAAMERAGELYRTTGINSPMANQPGIAVDGPDGAATSACRPNYHMLMSDGAWNTNTGTLGERDNNSIVFPDGVSYSPQRPYRLSGGGTLADVAFHYWANDLQPTVPNSVVPYQVTPTADYWNPRNNPATWQHMINFTVGLGLSSQLDGQAGRLLYQPATGTEPVSEGTYKGSYTGIVSGAVNWPAVSNDPGKVADMWHAAINSRGAFFSAEDPVTLRKAFEEIIARVKSEAASSGQSGAISGRTGRSGNLAFSVNFDSKTWYSTLRARTVLPDGRLGSTVWSTDSTLVNDSGRSIFTWNSATGSGRAFAWASFTPAEQLSLFSNNQNLFNWLRGDRTNEGTLFRARTQLLGDIINSDLVVAGKQDLGYALLPGAAGSSYRTFVDRKRTMIFTGANDGMLHAFRADGTEAFAYVPGAVLPKLKSLPAQPYVYQATVDGPLALWDYYTTSGWRTILVGGLGGGGRSFFGLDVTGPTSSTGSAFTSSNVLFEITDSDIGYTFGRPVVGRLPNGQWVAIFANGYGGASNRAMLIVRNLSTGVVTKIDTGVGTSASPNGLSSPTALSLGNGEINAIYAGDYRGNMWRFDVNSSGAWSVGNSGAPLFTATDNSGNRQPIIAAPTLMKHPGGGFMVLFGTGKFFEKADRDSYRVQSFYGLRDTGTPITSRSELVAQSIDNGNSVGANQRTVTNNLVDYRTRRGWYIDLNSIGGNGPGGASGERVVAKAVLVDEFVMFNTFISSLNPCQGLGTGFLMGVNAFQGSLPDALFDEDNSSIVGDAGDRLGGKGIAGTKRPDGASLTSPVASLVTTIQSADGGAPPAVGCGAPGQPPCPQTGCGGTAFLNPRTNLCEASRCPSGGVVVDGKCSLTGRNERWLELRWN